MIKRALLVVSPLVLVVSLAVAAQQAGQEGAAGDATPGPRVQQEGARPAPEVSGQVGEDETSESREKEKGKKKSCDHRKKNDAAPTSTTAT